MIEAKQLTTNTWIVSDNGSVVGLITKHDEQFSVTTSDAMLTFSDMKSAKKHFGVRVKETISKASLTEEKPQTDIDGYPVKHDNITVVRVESPPIYTRANSTYLAGYWAIKYTDIWVSAYCPLLSTIEAYTHAGPFKSSMEMKSTIATNNKLKK